MESQLDRALQGTLAILTKDPGLAAELLTQARLAIADAYRSPDGQALFGPAREIPAGAGSADQLAAFLGRVV
jgi:hypothetical protein